MLSTAISNFFASFPAKPTFWLGYSGGLDSRVLLALCAQYHQAIPIQLKVIHINHGLHPAAKTWAEQCAKDCKKYGFEYIEHTIQLKLNAGDSLEEVARIGRYTAFANYMKYGDVLLTAHQQDDQAETLLLQLLRGAGLKGLAAMPAKTGFGDGFHARPLLAFPRDVLQNYAKQHQLTWIDDPSNADLRLTRNFIRQEILSRLKHRWPTASNLIARSASHCAEAQVLLEDISVTEWLKVAGSRVNTLSVKKLLNLEKAKQCLVLRTWFNKLGHPTPDMKKLASICQSVLPAKSDRMPSIHWRNTELRRYRDDLYLMPSLLPHDDKQIVDWEIMQPLELLGGGKISAVLSKGYGLRAEVKRVSLRFRSAGDIFHFGKRGKQYLKNLFQEWGVPPWERNRIPLLFVEEQLVMVVGYYIADDFAATGEQMGYTICFRNHS